MKMMKNVSKNNLDNLSNTSKETVNSLLDVAEILFAEYGFSGTTVREISAKANINQALINYHFKSKQGLFKAIFERRAKELVEDRLRLLSQARQAANGAPIPLRDLIYDKVSLEFVDEFHKTLPDLPVETISWRLIFVMGLYIYVASNTGRLEVISRNRCAGERLDQALPEILAFCENGFLAPVL